MLQGEQEASLQSYFQSDPLPFSVSEDQIHNNSHVFQPHSVSPTVGPEGELIHPQNDVVTDIMNLRTLQLDPQSRSNFVNALANSAALRSRLSNPPSPISHLSTRKRPSSHPPILNQVYNSFCGHCKQRLVEILKSLIYNNVEDRKMISELCVRCLRLFFNIPKKVILMEQYLAQQLKPLGYLPEAYLYELLTPPKQSPKPLKDVFLATDNPTHSSWPESTSASSFFTTLRLPDNVFDEVDRLFAVQPNSVNLELADNVPLDIFSEFTKVAAPSSPSCLLHQIEEKERAEKERIEYEKRRKEEEEESRKRMLTNNMFRIDSGACLEFKNSDFVLPSNEGMQSFHTDIPHQPEIFSSPAKAPSVNEFEHEEDALNNFAQPQPVKRKRGRPPSKNKKLDALRRNSMPVKLPSQWDAISSELDAQLSPTKTTAQTKRASTFVPRKNSCNLPFIIRPDVKLAAINTAASGTPLPISVPSGDPIQPSSSSTRFSIEPTIFQTFTNEGIDWCRYCGTTDGINWRPGPWGKKTLCNKHGCSYKGYGFATRESKLNLTAFVDESLEERIRPVLQYYCFACQTQECVPGNVLVMCDGCPKTFHQNCKQGGIPDEIAHSHCKYYCSPACKNTEQTKKIVVENPKVRNPLMQPSRGRRPKEQLYPVVIVPTSNNSLDTDGDTVMGEVRASRRQHTVSYKLKDEDDDISLSSLSESPGTPESRFTS